MLKFFNNAKVELFLNQIRPKIEKQLGCVLLGNVENDSRITRKLLQEIHQKLPENYMLIPFFLTKNDGKKRDNDILDICLIGLNESVIWEAFKEFFKATKQSGNDEKNIEYYRESGLKLKAMFERDAGIQLTELEEDVLEQDSDKVREHIRKVVSRIINSPSESSPG
jgi:hypothetical protein